MPSLALLGASLLLFGCEGEIVMPSAGADAAAAGDEPDAAGADAALACLAATEPCEGEGGCCSGLSCGTTSLGQVCCGGVGASCKTWNGEDCCDQLLCVDGTCQEGQAMFKAPYPCDESWTYSHHSAEVRLALDFVRDGGGTAGAPVLASAGGIAYRHFEPGGAGNYVSIDHSGGWTTYYFHLAEFSVPDATEVAQGQQIGTVGSTGASSGPHIHYEQLQSGAGQTIHFGAESLAPYPPFYGERSFISDNGCP